MKKLENSISFIIPQKDAKDEVVSDVAIEEALKDMSIMLKKGYVNTLERDYLNDSDYLITDLVDEYTWYYESLTREDEEDIFVNAHMVAVSLLTYFSEQEFIIKKNVTTISITEKEFLVNFDIDDEHFRAKFMEIMF